MHITELLENGNQTALLNELVRGGKWNPNAFMHAFERADKTNKRLTQILQKVQETEFRVLLSHFCEEPK
jgi:hypothetical protein